MKLFFLSSLCYVNVNYHFISMNVVHYKCELLLDTSYSLVRFQSHLNSSRSWMILATARIGSTLNLTLDLSCQVMCGSVGL